MTDTKEKVPCGAATPQGTAAHAASTHNHNNAFSFTCKEGKPCYVYSYKDGGALTEYASENYRDIRKIRAILNSLYAPYGFFEQEELEVKDLQPDRKDLPPVDAQDRHLAALFLLTKYNDTVSMLNAMFDVAVSLEERIRTMNDIIWNHDMEAGC